MKTKIVKTLALLLAAVLMLSLVACGGDAPKATEAPAANPNNGGNVASAPAEDGSRKIVIQTLSDPGTFTAFEATSSVSTAIEGAFYEHLFAQYTAGELTPVVASGYERVADGVYEITVRDGVYDSKGNPISVDDIVWAYQTVIEHGKRSTVYGNVKNVEKIDDHSIRITLGEEFVGEFASIVTSLAIISRASFEESETGFASDPVGTGPYKIKSWTQGSSLVLEKNENYWNKETMADLQPYDEIEYRFISEPTQVALALETGAVDLALGVSPQDAPKFTEDKGFHTVTIVDSLCRGLLFNCHESNPFSNVKLRQAVCYAIDAEAAITAATDGVGKPCKALVAANDQSAYSDYNMEWNDQSYYDYNPEKAKELLAEAGYPNGLKVRIMTKDNPEYRTTCEIMQAYLAEVGVEVEILAYENALYQTYRYDPSAFDICVMQIGGTQSVLQPWKWYVQPDPARDNLNVCMFYDEEFWDIYGEAVHESTHSPETVEVAWQWMKENVPMYGYGYTNKYFIYNDNVTDPFVNPMNIRKMEFLEAANAINCTDPRIIFRHVLRKRQMLWSPAAVELNREISDILSQSHALTLLNMQGLVDPDIFISKSNQLAEQLRNAKQQKEILRDMEYDQSIDTTQQLQETLLTGLEILDTFDGELFCELIDRIILQSNTKIRFRLKNGLELPESIERTVR